MNDEIRAYHKELGPKWHSFLEQLADAQHPRDPNRVGWGPEDEAWRDTYLHLDHAAAAYVAWQANGIVINEWGPVDDRRLLELIEPYVAGEADRRVFLATCQRLMSEWQNRSPSNPG
jgi:hypothetical protein